MLQLSISLVSIFSFTLVTTLSHNALVWNACFGHHKHGWKCPKVSDQFWRHERDWIGFPIHFLAIVTANTAGNCPEVSWNISCGVLRNVEQILEHRLGLRLPAWQPRHRPPFLIQKSGDKLNKQTKMWHVLHKPQCGASPATRKYRQTFNPGKSAEAHKPKCRLTHPGRCCLVIRVHNNVMCEKRAVLLRCQLSLVVSSVY